MTCFLRDCGAFMRIIMCMLCIAAEPLQILNRKSLPIKKSRRINFNACHCIFVLDKLLDNYWINYFRI